MSESIEYTKEDEMKNIKMGRPHVVLLGAGASKAAFPNGDINGNPLPLMEDLVEITGLIKILEKFSIPVDGNFENIFSDLYLRDKNHPAICLIEEALFKYFSEMDLEDWPTIYDYLVLSLRKKDVIATFNWDPLLWLAAARHHNYVDLPHIIFLHGNVAVGYCHKCSKKGQHGYKCSKCGELYTASKLLYPIKQKNYSSDPGIKGEWTTMQNYIKHAFLFTIFGYSAPATDVEAIKMLKEAWGDKYKRNLEQIEFIHKPGSEEKKVIEPWREFIHTHHYHTTDDFFNSSIAKHPRRTCEAAWSQLMECLFTEGNPVPKDIGLIELQHWFRKLARYETE
jgi:NAD-dependent SIR2 family protein deacetylase